MKKIKKETFKIIIFFNIIIFYLACDNSSQEVKEVKDYYQEIFNSKFEEEKNYIFIKLPICSYCENELLQMFENSKRIQGEIILISYTNRDLNNLKNAIPKNTSIKIDSVGKGFHLKIIEDVFVYSKNKLKLLSPQELNYIEYYLIK